MISSPKRLVALTGLPRQSLRDTGSKHFHCKVRSDCIVDCIDGVRNGEGEEFLQVASSRQGSSHALT